MKRSKSSRTLVNTRPTKNPCQKRSIFFSASVHLALICLFLTGPEIIHLLGVSREMGMLLKNVLSRTTFSTSNPLFMLRICTTTYDLAMAMWQRIIHIFSNNDGPLFSAELLPSFLETEGNKFGAFNEMIRNFVLRLTKGELTWTKMTLEHAWITGMFGGKEINGNLDANLLARVPKNIEIACISSAICYYTTSEEQRACIENPSELADRSSLGLTPCYDTESEDEGPCDPMDSKCYNWTKVEMPDNHSQSSVPDHLLPIRDGDESPVYSPATP